MKINIKLLIIILLSIFSAGYVIITSRKIDNLKREILIEKAKNNRIIDSLINENKIKEENIFVLTENIKKSDFIIDSLENNKDGVSVYIPPVSNSVEKSASLLKQNLCEN